MRVTNNMVSRNYLSGLQKTFSDMNKTSQQIYTGRRFDRMSEDTSAGVRAMQVRRKMAQIPAYKDNAKSVSSKFAAAEKTLMQISDLNKSVADAMVKGLSDNNGPDERLILGKEIDKLQEEFLTLANGQFSNQYMFGGTNNGTPPFTLEGEPKEIFYNGAKLSEITKNDALFNDKAFVDIGLGITKDASGNIKENTMFPSTLVGLEFMGTGEDNLYQLMSDISKFLKDGAGDKVEGGALLDRFRKATDNANLMVTRLGADSQYLDFTIDRLETEEINLTERQQQLEAIPPEEAIINLKMQEFVYNAALQMGQRLLQPTLFSFIN